MDRLQADRIHVPGVEVRVLERCTSTNEILMKEQPVKPRLLAAEEQTAGRGRRGRRWQSLPGRSITFSLARRVVRPLRELAALSLVAGVATARALRALGAAGVALKWPNDLVVGEAKLGGILVETRASRDEAQGSAVLAVIGVGLNSHGAGELAARVRRRVAALDELIDTPRRGEVIARIGAMLMTALDAFEAQGFDGVRREWEGLDAHAGRRLRVRLADGRVVSGVDSGLAADGALRLRTRGGVRAVASGRVLSSRAA